METIPTPAAPIQKRNIALYCILTLVTCGFFGLYWFCTLNDDTNTVSGHPEAMTGIVAILLTLLTCGIYGFIWMYNMGERIDEAKARRGQPGGSSGVIYLILMLVGVGIIPYILLQNELNKLAE